MSALLLNAALAYAERLGWAVFPLRGKVPAISAVEPGGRGHLDATTNPETIREFWARHPRANIGVSCIASGFLALDCDPRHGGDRALAVIEGRYGLLPHTVRQITDGGGEHILFGLTGDIHPRGSLGRGIDVRYRGAITIAPSVHPERGRRYAWGPGHHPRDTPIAEPPAWLVDQLTPDAEPSPVGQARPAIEEDAGWGPRPWYSRAALRRACEAIEAAPVGEQDQTLNREAYSIGRLIGAGLMPCRLALDCLSYSATMMCNAPGRRRWRERELQQKVARAVREGEHRPREVA